MTELPFPYQGPDALREPVLAALRRVVDPEVAMNIVDVGLVYGVAIDGPQVQVRVTMTSAACPVAGVIVEDIEHELWQALPEDMQIAVDLVWEPPWSPERLSDKARRFMGW